MMTRRHGGWKDVLLERTRFLPSTLQKSEEGDDRQENKQICFVLSQLIFLSLSFLRSLRVFSLPFFRVLSSSSLFPSSYVVLSPFVSPFLLPLLHPSAFPSPSRRLLLAVVADLFSPLSSLVQSPSNSLLLCPSFPNAGTPSDTFTITPANGGRRRSSTPFSKLPRSQRR